MEIFAPRKSWLILHLFLVRVFGSRITVERFVGVKMTMNCNPANFSAVFHTGFEWKQKAS